jgi:hypothetical protein
MSAHANINDATTFLEEFFGTAPWALVAIRPRGDDPEDIRATTLRGSPKREEVAAEWIRRHNGEGYNLYFAPNPLKALFHRKAAKGDVAAATWLWADLDPPKKATPEETAAWRSEKRKEITGGLPCGLPAPTWTIDSGRGFWLFWRLKAPLPVDGKDGPLTAAVEAYGRMIEQAFAPWTDSCRNIDRIARLPGTVNHKTGWTAGVIAHHPDAAYELEDFPEPAKPEPQAEEQPSSTSSRSDKVDLEKLPSRLRDRILRQVEAGEDHSGVFHNVVTSLAELGFSAAAIKELLGEHRACVPDRFWGRLEEEITRSLGKQKAAAEAAVSDYLTRMNGEYAIVRDGGKCRVLYFDEQGHGHSRRVVPAFMSFDDFKNYHARDYVPRPGQKDVPLGHWWLGTPRLVSIGASPSRRTARL